MSYLLSLVGALNEDERRQLLASGVRGKERELLESAIYIVKHKKDKDEFTAEANGLSRSHFDKINSVLIKKIYAVFTDGSFEKISELLKTRGLTALLLHQAELENRRIKTVRDKQVRKQFYQVVFEVLRKLPQDTPAILKLLKKYGDLLKPLLDKNNIDTPLVIDLKYVYILNSYHFFNTGITYIEKGLTNITTLMPNPEKYKGKPEYSHYHLNLTIYYRDFKTEFKRAIDHINQAIDNAHKCALKNDQAFLASLYGVRATSLCQDSQFQTALNTYKEAYAMFPDWLTKSFYHNYLFPTTAILCREFKMAKEHMDKYIAPVMEGALYFKFDAIRLYALYYMYTGNMTEAYKYIQQALSIRRKQMTDSGDIMYRMVENLYFLLIKDYQLAVSLANKNQRFLKRKGYTLQNSAYMHLFYACEELAKMKLKGNMNKDKITESLNICHQGVLCLFGGLLDEVR